MKYNYKKIAIVVVLFTFFILFAGITESLAQCPMCRMAAESNLENGGTAGRGLNAGILYMLATPYLIIGVIGFIWWRNRTSNKEQETTTENKSF